MGDVGLLKQTGINPAIAESWKAVANDDFLSETTWTLAERFGYDRPDRQGAEDRRRRRSRSGRCRASSGSIAATFGRRWSRRCRRRARRRSGRCRRWISSSRSLTPGSLPRAEPQQVSTQWNAFFPFLLLHLICYMPTLALANSVLFQNSKITSHANNHWFVDVPSSKAGGMAFESRACQSRRISGRTRRCSRGCQFSPSVRL